MSGKKLINKIMRRKRYVQELNLSKPKIDKNDDITQANPGVQKLMRGVQRRLDESFGYDAVPAELIEYKIALASLERVDFGGSDYGLRAQFAGGVATAEITEITCVGDDSDIPGVAEETDVVCVADVAGSLNSTYFTFHTPENSYYVWFNVDAAGVDPEVADHIGIEVAISEDDADTVVAAALEAEIDLLSDASASVAGATVTILNDSVGAVTASADGAAPTGFTITQEAEGVDAGFDLNDKYFLINSPSASYYVWFNVGSAGTDPEIAGKFGVEVELTAGDAAADVAAALAAALDALDDLEAEDDGAVVTVTAAAGGAAMDPADGAAATTFTFEVTTQGSGDLAEASGIQPGDSLQLLNGDLQGMMLEVVEVLGSSAIRLDDVATFSSETDIQARILISAVKKSYV